MKVVKALHNPCGGLSRHLWSTLMFNYLFIILLQSVVTFLSLFEKGFCHILNTFLFSVSFLLHFGTFLSVFCHNLGFQSLIILSNYNLLSDFCELLLHFCHIFEMAGPTLNLSTGMCRCR